MCAWFIRLCGQALRAAAGLVAIAACASAQAGLVVDLDAGARQPLETGVEVLEDAEGRLELAAVRAAPASRWSAHALPLNFGYTRSAFWVRVQLRNPDRFEATARVLQIGSPVQDYVELAWIDADAHVHVYPRSGDREAFAARPIGYAMPNYLLRFKGGETITVYLRLATHDGLHEPVALELWTPGGFFEAAQLRLLKLGVYDGLTLVLLIYCGSIYVRSRQRVAGYYCGYLMSIGLWNVTLAGHGLQYLWPQHPVLNNQVLPLLMGGAFFFGLRFTSEALELRERAPRMHRMVVAGAWATLVATTPALFGFYAFSFIVSAPLGAVVGLAALGCGFVFMRHSGQAFWTLAAWVALVISVSLYLLELLGLRPASPNAADGLILGCTLQVLLLGLGVADAGERLRRGKLEAERGAREAQEGLALRLEQQVRDRTHELERANRRLEELAITDALTGAYNRRHFNDTLEAEIQRLRREGGCPALCLIDIDHFKAYNDHYGHPRGDAVLKAVSAALRNRMQRADDRLYRVGGEEFAIILRPADDRSAQWQYIDELRDAIQGLGIDHEGSPSGRVTASFGLAQPEPGSVHIGAAALYREADRLLYCAKTAGRNRVIAETRPVSQWAPTDFTPVV